MANRLRVHDPDFTAEDLADASNDPQWLQELTNNYRKLYLNNLWHLLPQSDTEVKYSANADENRTIVESNFTNLNVQAKNEPKTASVSPMNVNDTNNNAHMNSEIANEPNQIPMIPVQQQLQQPIANNNNNNNTFLVQNSQPVMNDLSYNLNNMNLNNNDYSQQQEQTDQVDYSHNTNSDIAQQQNSLPFYPNYNSQANNYTNQEGHGQEGYNQTSNV